jgi:hypothetical protein
MGLKTTRVARELHVHGGGTRRLGAWHMARCCFLELVRGVGLAWGAVAQSFDMSVEMVFSLAFLLVSSPPSHFHRTSSSWRSCAPWRCSSEGEQLGRVQGVDVERRKLEEHAEPRRDSRA